MSFVKKNFTNFKGSEITQYLIFEGLDVIGQATLLDDSKIASLEKPTDGVWLWA
jgi:hypothetical protein